MKPTLVCNYVMGIVLTAAMCLNGGCTSSHGVNAKPWPQTSPNLAKDEEVHPGGVNPYRAGLPVIGRYAPIDRLAWSSDGGRLFTSGSQGTVTLWEPLNATMWNQVSYQRPYASSLSSSPSSNTVLVGSNTGKAFLLDGYSLQIKVELPIADQYNIYAVALSKDETCLAATNHQGVHLWDVEQKKHLLTFGQKGKHYTAMTFSPDGLRLATFNQTDDRLEIWNTQTGLRIGPAYWLYASQISFSEDGKTLYMIQQNKVFIWRDGQTAIQNVEAPQSLIAEGGNEIHVEGFILSTGFRYQFIGESALSADHKTVASLVRDGSIALWLLETGKIVRTLPSFSNKISDSATGDLKQLAFSPNGKWLAGVTKRGKVVFWKL